MKSRAQKQRQPSRVLDESSANLATFPDQPKLATITPAIREGLRSSVRLVAGERSAKPTTRLGGRPNLPPSVAWPVWREEPLSFIAQIDLAHLPTIPGLNLPRAGALYFFYDALEQPWGFDPADRGCARVLYSRVALAESPVRRPPKELETRFPGVVAAVTPLEITFPDISSPLFDAHTFSIEQKQDYWEAKEGWEQDRTRTLHRIGGHADVIQGDPRPMVEFVSNGVYCGDTAGYKKGKKRGLLKNASQWELLLQVDSDKKAGMEWGDVGRLYFFVRKADLENRNFDNVWLVLQCY